MKVYLVEENGGCYDDSYKYFIGIFYTKESALQEVQYHKKRIKKSKDGMGKKHFSEKIEEATNTNYYNKNSRLVYSMIYQDDGDKIYFDVYEVEVM